MGFFKKKLEKVAEWQKEQEGEVKGHTGSNIGSIGEAKRKDGVPKFVKPHTYALSVVAELNEIAAQPKDRKSPSYAYALADGVADKINKLAADKKNVDIFLVMGDDYKFRLAAEGEDLSKKTHVRYDNRGQPFHVRRKEQWLI